MEEDLRRRIRVGRKMTSIEDTEWDVNKGTLVTATDLRINVEQKYLNSRSLYLNYN